MLSRACLGSLCFFVLAFHADPAAVAAEDPPDAETVVRFGDSVITAAHVRSLRDGLEARERDQIRKDPKILTALIRQEVARQLVLRESASKEFVKRPDIAKKIERARDDIVVESYLDQVVSLPGGFPTEEDLKTAYELNQKQFYIPRQYRVSQFVVDVATPSDKAAVETARKAASEFYAKAKADPAKFDSLIPVGIIGKGGGDLGWVVETQLQESVRRALSGLNKDEVSEPLYVENTNGSGVGWHVFKLVETKAARVAPLQEVRDGLVEALKRQRLQQARERYLAGLLDRNSPVVNELALRKIAETEK